MATQTHRSMSISYILIGLAVLWGFIGLAGGESWAGGDSELSRQTLRGVEGVYVLIEDFKPEVERAGLAKEQLQTDVEVRLRQAGIRVYTHEELLRAQGQPYLYVNAGVILHSDGLVSYGITVEFRQRASLDINAVSAPVTTWSTGGFGTAGILGLHTLRDTVCNFVDQFINAYLSVSPRPAGSAAPSSPSPRRDLVRQVQERLLIVGYNPGSIDGAMGPQTRDALRWFQNTKGLRSTGDLDEPTLNALGIR